MSNQDHHDDTIGRSIEPWLAILLLSLVPLVTAVLLPEAWRMPLYVVGGAMCAAGVVLLVKQEVQRS
jgi:hypothetical protein